MFQVTALSARPNTCFFYKQHISNARLKFAKKNRAKDKQHREAELLLFKNYFLSSSTLSSINNREYFKISQPTTKATGTQGLTLSGIVQGQELVYQSEESDQL